MDNTGDSSPRMGLIPEVFCRTLGHSIYESSYHRLLNFNHQLVFENWPEHLECAVTELSVHY
jgi:hypothetical protein